MRVFPVRNPLAGELVAAVQPEMKPRVDTAWRRRLNLYAGRTLSHSALVAEQRARASKMALLGQAVTPGVVTGLEIGLETGGLIQVAPGLGVTAGGEDVRLLGPLRVRLADLRLYAPVSILESNTPPPDGPLAPRRLGDTLRELSDDPGITTPRALILVLQPILGERIGDFDATDPCERDSQNEAFEDQQVVDGCRLIAWAWPREWLPLPSRSARWRNDLAWAVFTREMEERAAGRRMPWEEQGVPVGLYSRDPMTSEPFLDRFSVVRTGGRSLPGSFPIEGIGDPWLWQARLQQFAEHLTQLQDAGESQLARHFRTLPPVGLLPRGSTKFKRPLKPAPEQEAETGPALGGDHAFFPPPFDIVATPVPLDELETVFQASAELAPVDLMYPPFGETIQLLVPVPGDLYDPDLLIEEVVSDEFDKAIQEIKLRRTEWRLRRDDLRTKVEPLNLALFGLSAKPLDPDPNDSNDELPYIGPALKEDPYGTENGKVPALDQLERAFTEPTGPFYALKQEVQGLSGANFLRNKGMVKFILDIQDKVDRVDDKVDFGFLSVQTSIYKLRQLVVGNKAATRVATSPTLAEIAKRPSSLSTRRDLQSYMDVAKGIQINRALSSFAPEGGEEARMVQPAAAVNLNLSASLNTDELFSSGDLVFKPKVKKTSLIASAISPSFSRAPIFTKEDVIEQAPIVGKPVRTVAIAQRIQNPYAIEVRDAAVATKHRVVLSFLDDETLPMVADVKVPGMLRPSDPQETPLPVFQQVKDLNLVAQILQDAFDPEPPAQSDEAAYFAAAVKPLDDASAILRVVEARLQIYRAALVHSVEVLSEVEGFSNAANTRFAFLEKKLAEARHDLVVAQALLEEERKRVSDLNEQRDLILDEHVRFLVYQRPRVADILVDTPVRPLEPPPLRDPLPACQGREIEPPEELREMLDLLREAPIRWFSRLPQLLQNLNRLDILQSTLQGARGRAAAVLAAAVVPPPPPVFSVPVILRATYQTVYAQKTNLSRIRIETAQVDLSRLQQQTWNNAIELARRILSVGDLLDLPHGRAQVSQQTARELEQITQAVTCLYDVFGDVLPTMRLDWAERLSQFDEETDLRSLAALPGWERVEPLTRRLLQGLVDWLFQRVVSKEPEAVAMMSDLIRVALLLASHAPVDRIVAATVAEATTVKKGGSVRLKVNPALVRVGMHVLVYSGSQTVARGVLEDVGDGHAVARVVDAYQENVKLAEEARVQITEPNAFAAKATSFRGVP